jgi:hypothetical protein
VHVCLRPQQQVLKACALFQKNFGTERVYAQLNYSKTRIKENSLRQKTKKESREKAKN